MAVNVTTKRIGLMAFYRTAMGQLQALRTNPREPEWFWFVGDNSETDFSLPAGWRPKAVSVGGALKRGKGTTPDFTITGPVVGVYTLSFTVAPGTSVDVGVEAWPIIR